MAKLQKGVNDLKTWCLNNGDFGQRLMSEWRRLDINGNKVNIDAIHRGSNTKVAWECNIGHWWYTSPKITKANADLLQQGKYNKPVKAFEYSNPAITVNDQTEVLVKLSYNTQNMFDTLHPSAYRILDSIIKKAKVKKADVTDSQLVNHLLRTYTGVRIHGIDKSSKAYTNTECMFKSQGLLYILRPDSVKVLGTQAIQ